MRRLVFWQMLAWPLAVDARDHGEHYDQATIAADGRLHLRLSTGTDRWPTRLAKQAAFGAAEITRDGSGAGWLALYPNCCTSYPVALSWVFYRDGKVRRVLTGNGLAFSRWHFQADDRQVAFEQETVHGHRGVHYELRDIASGRLLAHYEGDPAADAPTWVRDLTPAENTGR